jgi:hypothetical protein
MMNALSLEVLCLWKGVVFVSLVDGVRVRVLGLAQQGEGRDVPRSYDGSRYLLRASRLQIYEVKD